MGKEAFTSVLAVQQATECHNPAAPQLDAFYVELVNISSVSSLDKL